MRITVKGYHRLRRYTAGLRADGRLTVPDGISAAGVLERLAIPEPLQGEILMFVNGRPCRPEQSLRSGDTLALLEKVTGG